VSLWQNTVFDAGARKRPQGQDNLARLSAMITNIYDNMGRLFQRLDEFGITHNTIVVFLTDNGPNTRRYVGPFRGMKSELIAESGRFDVRLESHPMHEIDASKTWTAKIEVAGRTFETSFDPTNRIAIFRGLQLPVGKTKLKPWIETRGEDPICIYHVWVSAR
jgi:hypothetical protein